MIAYVIIHNMIMKTEQRLIISATCISSNMEAKKKVQAITRYVLAQSETTVERARQSTSAQADYRDTTRYNFIQATQNTYELNRH
jgi:hypothetical protein